MHSTRSTRRSLFQVAALAAASQVARPARAQEPAAVPDVARAFIDADGPGWLSLGAEDFINVNCDPDTWTFEGDLARCKGTPIGVFRSIKTYTNFEIIFRWRHLKSAGNSGMFMWTPEEALQDLKRDALPPGGIEIQVLDTGYAEYYENKTGKKAEFFTCHGDVFAVGKSRMKPFPPLSPNGSRSFPSKNMSRGTGLWNHYYVRCINGEVRLWVNGEEVSGGNQCEPRSGHICLESEGSPLEFKGIRIRELP